MGYTDDVGAVFSSARLAIYPTLTEGFGLSILEALTHGCPVVSYDVDFGPREMIFPGRNGELAPPGDIPAISRAIENVLSNSAYYQANTDMELDRYSRTAHEQSYLDLIFSAMRQAPDENGKR
ncbi:Glycosyl transferases group 1 [Paracoccus thiocyanatus]|uniref:Glycosyl transferases group 1 n=1 Tax=Paracoccus thiocyanatus TaxID=34006 RepID=A0A1N6P1V7_9RHOB|nr:glycosyltransferase family 4 protein [Paracoccus thiocyanatus]SIP98266.1 Glycosyl transferases group 1 [Paracoccus thiocyanatus]